MNPDDPDKIDSENGAIDGMIREFARTGAASDDQPLIDLIESAIDQSTPKDSEVSPWLFGRYFWSAVGAFAAIFVLFLGLPGIKNYTQKAVTTELLMVSQSRFVPGGEAIVRGLIRNGKEQWPLKGQVVKANLVAENGQTIELGEAVSDSQGIIFISTTLPAEMGEGSYTLQLLSDDDISVEKSIPVQRSFRTLLSTDKPMYQPGQIIHMRALSLSQDGLMPATGREVKFEIRDPKGNKVFGKKEQTSEYGIAAYRYRSKLLRAC